ncbi:MAG: hypothetical protein GEU93_16860 [Propionibacteriales bacterium]|nr:hypothetical protein [Propionibacteriales bacterium]
MNNNYGRFEDRLLAELKQVVARRAADAEPEPAGKVRGSAWRSRFALAGGVAAVGAAAVMVMPTLGGSGTSSAYAVTTNDSGTVTVRIEQFSDAAGLEQKLEEKGIPATVYYLPTGQMCQEPWFTGDADAGARLAEPDNDGSSGFTFTLDPDDFTGNKSLVVEAAGPERGVEDGASLMVAIASGPVGDCEPVGIHSGGDHDVDEGQVHGGDLAD